MSDLSQTDLSQSDLSQSDDMNETNEISYLSFSVKRKPRLLNYIVLSEGLCLCGCKRSNTLIQLVKETEQHSFSWKETFSILVSTKYVMCDGVVIGTVAFIKTNLEAGMAQR